MKLDRNLNPDGKGKYALIKMHRVQESFGKMQARNGRRFLIVPEDAIDHGGTPETDFFVIRLKDKYAAPALQAYANAAVRDDPEYAAEIAALAKTAYNYPAKRIPD